MNNGVLTQEEIDALLKTSSNEDAVETASTTPAAPVAPDVIEPPQAPAAAAAAPTEVISVPRVDEVLSTMEQDALGEISNISMGSAATALSTLLDKKVEITTPRIEITTYKKLQSDYPLPFVVIDVQYTQGLQGDNLLIIRNEDAAIVADLMMGGDGTNPPAALSDIHLSAIGEAMNQMMGSSCTAMSQVISQRIDITAPSVRKVNLASEPLTLGGTGENDLIIKVAFKAVIGNLMNSEIMQLIPLEFGKELSKTILRDVNTQTSTAVPAPVEAPYNEIPAPSVTPIPQVAIPVPPAPVLAPEPQQIPMGGYAAQQPPGYPGYMPPQQVMGMPNQQQMYYNPQQFATPQPGTVVTHQPVTVQPAQFAPLNTGTNAAERGNIGLIMDVPLHITVELGKTRKTIKEILALGPGSVVELDKLAGEPVDLMVNGKLLARGEVVVIDENFGIRVTDIISPIERVSNLQ